VKWTTETASADENGNKVVNTASYEGKVKGVSISDGAPSIIAEADGKTYQVPISEVTRVGEGV